MNINPDCLLLFGLNFNNKLYKTRAPAVQRAGSEARYEVSAGRWRCWQMGCMERWHRRHSQPPGKPVSCPPSGADTHCIRQVHETQLMDVNTWRRQWGLTEHIIVTSIKYCNKWHFNVVPPDNCSAPQEIYVHFLKYIYIYFIFWALSAAGS